jgi:hypothetical protein
VSLRAGTIDYGTADAFGVLGEAGVTNTNSPTMIDGSVAGSTGTPAITGFPPGTVNSPGVLYLSGVANSGPGTPFGDAAAAYTTANGLSGASEGTLGLGSGGLTTLAAGVYSFTSPTVLLNGLLMLDAGGSDNASWTFQIPYALTTASGSSVEVVDAGGPGPFTGSITWAVGSQATLGSTSTFLGTIISGAATVLDTGATIGCGRAISLNASVTLDDNIIDANPADCAVTTAGASGADGATGGTGASGSTGIIGAPPSPVPEPGTFAMFPSGLLALAFLALRKSR